MGEVLVKRATIRDGTIAQLAVVLEGLGERVIDRETAVAWMRDGHSLIPWVAGQRRVALQLVELADAGHAIRVDNTAEAADSLPELPSV